MPARTTLFIFRGLPIIMNGQEKRDRIVSRVRDALLPALPLRVAWMYGSVLTRDDFRDIDIALLLDPKVPDNEAISFASEVANRIETAIGFCQECDVRVINREPVWFQYEVIKSGIPLFVRDEQDRLDFETGVMVEYLDMKYTYDLFDREYLARA